MAAERSSSVTCLSLNEVLKAIEHNNLHLTCEQVGFLCDEIISVDKKKLAAKKTGGRKNVHNNSIDLNKFIENFCEKFEIMLDSDDIVPKPKTLWPSFCGKKYFATVKLNYGTYGSLLLEGTKSYIAGFVYEGKALSFEEVVPGTYFSPYGFQKQMEKMFNQMVPVKAVVYLDVIYVFGDTEDELYINASQAIKQISVECKMYVDRAEATLFQKSVELLGYRVSKGKLKIPQSTLEFIEDIKRPATLIELFKFMAVAGFYKEMIKGFARLAAPLSELLDTPLSVVKEVDWQQQHQIGFQVLQKKLLNKPVLTLCDARAEKILYVTCSKIAIEGDLYQIDLKTAEKVAIGYFSAKVEADMKNWEPFDLEMLAITESCLFFQPYLKKSFTVFTNNSPQMYRDHFRSASAQLKKLRSKIDDFAFKVRLPSTTVAGHDDFYEFTKRT